MIENLKNWVKEKLFFETSSLSATNHKEFKNNNNPPLNTQQIRAAEEIELLRQALSTDSKNCALLEEALHNKGLDGFALLLPQIAKQYGYFFSTEDFRDYLSRKKFKHQAAYLVQYCRGGGIV